MEFEVLPTIDGYRAWGTVVAGVSYVVGFDTKFPERGFSASIRRPGEEKVLLGEGYPNRRQVGCGFWFSAHPSRAGAATRFQQWRP